MVIEVILERVTNISMGTEIDGITEFEELRTGEVQAPAEQSMLDRVGWTEAAGLRRLD